MIRTYNVKINVLRNGAVLTQLHPVSDPTIDCKSDAAIKVSMSGRFLDNPLVNWLTDELQPIQIINGIEHPVGVFPIGTVSDHFDENGSKSVSVEAYDRGLYLRQAKTETVLHFSSGTNYLHAVESLLVQAGISLYIATPTSEVLATDREDWAVGTQYLTIINELLAEIGYDQVWFNTSGTAVLRPAKTPSASAVDHTYGSTADLTVLQRPCALETDVFDRANVFVAICSNPDLPAPLMSSAVNDNPMSSLSVFKRGRRITQVLRVTNTPNQQALDAYVQQVCQNSMLAAETVTISTANVPNHGVYDTVAVLHPDLDGLFQEISWSIILAPGQTMIHKLRRSVLI